MKLQPGAPLAVSIGFDPTTPVPAARVGMDGGLAQLEWSQTVIASKLHVAGLYYPPAPGLQAANGREFNGLHGFLADSLPEGWGQLVMRKRLAKLDIDLRTLSALDRLALVGRNGRGALMFDPATTPPDEVETLDLDALAHDTALLLAGASLGSWSPPAA